MNQNLNKEVYQFAYDEASCELRRILRSFEELFAQKNRVEKLLEVLKPELDATVNPDPELVNSDAKIPSQRKSHLPNCTVITRLTLL
jgi:hypothetical protein